MYFRASSFSPHCDEECGGFYAVSKPASCSRPRPPDLPIRPCRLRGYAQHFHRRGQAFSGASPAILFAAEEDRPCVITVKYCPSNGCPIPFLQPYFDAPPESVVLTQDPNGKPLRFWLHIFYSPIALANASPINGAIYHLISGAESKPWAGTVVVLKFNGSRRKGYTDVSGNDLPALSAYFLAYQWIQKLSVSKINSTPTDAPRVRHATMDAAWMNTWSAHGSGLSL